MALSKAVPLVFFLALLLCLSSPATDAHADFYYFSLMWPGSHCNYQGYQCCVPTTGKPAHDFLIEGIWPADSTTGQTFQFCDTACKFKVNALQKLIGDMYKHWSDLSCPNNNGINLWKKTWCAYGTCSNFTKQRDYFNASLALFDDLDLLYVLEDNDITPSWTTTYSLSKIQQVLAANYGFSTVVLCNRDRPYGTSQIHQVIFCVANDGKTTIGCPTTLQSDCDANVRFAPFPDWLSPLAEGTTTPSGCPAATQPSCPQAATQPYGFQNSYASF